jgi:hypothetical protein
MSQATTVRICEAEIEQIGIVRAIWRRRGSSGPDSTLAQDVRYLVRMGCEYERYRLTDSPALRPDDELVEELEQLREAYRQLAEAAQHSPLCRRIVDEYNKRQEAQ